MTGSEGAGIVFLWVTSKRQEEPGALFYYFQVGKLNFDFIFLSFIKYEILLISKMN